VFKMPVASSCSSVPPAIRFDLPDQIPNLH
jgi:hypothetical protein